MTGISLKSPDDLAHMRRAGRLAADVLDMIEPYVVAGVSTAELDQRCHDYMVNEQHTIPACLNYGSPPFPKSTCISVNHVICHGIPSPDKILKNGDIVNIDVTVIKDGWHGDTNRTFIVGEGSVLAKRLVSTTYEALWRAIAIVKPGRTLGDIGHCIQTFAEGEFFSVVREFCGHGIGRGFHEEPQVLHYGRPGTGQVLVAGMTFTIEPMINAGRKELKVLNDGWTVVTRDRSLSAQFEHTLAVTAAGCEVLTLSAAERQRLGREY